MRRPIVEVLAGRAGLGLVAALVFAVPPCVHAQGRPPGPDVRVVNLPSEPVPVEVVTSAPLPVVIDGAVTIDTASPLPVTVVPTGGPQPFQVTLFQASQAFPGVDRFRVPSGKRLVIEDVSCDGVDADDYLLGIAVKTRAGIVDARHLCPFEVRVNTGRPGTTMSYAGARRVRAYADPGTEVVASFAGTTVAAFPLFSATLSGHLVDVP